MAKQIPKRLQFLHGFLANQTGLLHMRWGVYSKLYRADPRKRELLWWGAPGLFGMLDQAILDSIVLMLVKLLDPAELGKRRNATFDRLAETVRSSRLRKRVDAALQPARSFADALRIRRNKQLAHVDVRVAQGRYPRTWPNKTLKDLEAALDSLGATLNAISEHYGLDVVDFRGFGDMASGVDQLVSRLSDLRRLRPRDNSPRPGTRLKPPARVD